MSYVNEEVAQITLVWFNAGSEVWRGSTTLLNMEVVEWYNLDHAMRQFRFEQMLPTNPSTWTICTE